MKTGLLIIALGMCLSFQMPAQTEQTLYKNDFEQSPLDKVPDDLLVLDGAFAVKESDGNKFLELPGAPLESFGFLFGPTEKGGVLAEARVYGAAKGRRYPTFALGLNGVGGYRLQVSPAKKLLELYRGDFLKTTAPYDWQAGKWTHLRLQVRQTSAGWKIEGKAWTEGKSEPTAWLISAEDEEDLPAGRATIFGSPFSGTPIRYDDLALKRARG